MDVLDYINIIHVQGDSAIQICCSSYHDHLMTV